MKFIFICLVIANAMLFALGRGYVVASPLVETHQPQRLLQQENSQHLTLISANEANSPPPCWEWGIFSLSELAKVEARLKPLSFGTRQSRQPVQELASTVVYIPPLGSKAAAEKKVGELTRLGVTDFFIIQEPSSSLRWGISLGVFKSEEAAKQLLASLVAKGVRSAKLGTRTLMKNKFTYVFNELTTLEKDSLEQLKTEFPAQELRMCE